MHRIKVLTGLSIRVVEKKHLRHNITTTFNTVQRKTILLLLVVIIIRCKIIRENTQQYKVIQLNTRKYSIIQEIKNTTTSGSDVVLKTRVARKVSTHLLLLGGRE